MKWQLDNGRGWWLLLLLLLVFFASARTAWGQEPSEPEQSLSSQSLEPAMTPTETPPIDQWTNFDLAWNSLKDELLSSDEDSARLSTLLAGLLIEADELRYLLEQSTAQLKGSEKARLIEREASVQILADAMHRLDVAERRAKAWKIGSITLAGIVTVETILLILLH